MKRLQKIGGEQLAGDELLPEAPHQKGIGMQLRGFKYHPNRKYR